MKNDFFVDRNRRDDTTFTHMLGDSIFMFFFMILPFFSSVLTGCSLSSKHKGLITNAKMVTIVDVNERKRKIFSDEAKTLHQLDGCIVEVDGPRFGPFMIEQKWRILDAGDGSFPFLGKIEQRGIQYFIHDHNTQSIFKLEGEQNFSPFVDKKVLIVGFVIGSHDIRVLRIIELQ